MRYENVTYENETFALDGNEYVGCTFKNCKLSYSGGPIDLTNSAFKDSNVEFVGAARGGMEVFRLLQQIAIADSPVGALIQMGDSWYRKLPGKPDDITI